MTAHISDNKLVITTEPKTLYCDLPKDADNNLKHDIYMIIYMIILYDISCFYQKT